MKRILLAVAILFFTDKFGLCDSSPVEIHLTTNTAIYHDQEIIADVEITNIGSVELKIPREDTADFRDLLSIDNPKLSFSGGVSIISIGDQVPTVVLKPGENIKTSIYLSLKTNDHNLKWYPLSRPILEYSGRFKIFEESPPLKQSFQSLRTPSRACYV